MPRITESYVKSIVYLYSSIEDAQDGKTKGATGFLLGVPLHSIIGQEQHYQMVLVTNAHVIESGANAIRLNKLDGQSDCRQLNVKWFFHPDGDDVALALYEVDKKIHDHEIIPSTFFIDSAFIDEYDVGIGDEVIIIGRFKYHEGRRRNLPSARFGYISQMPEETISVSRRVDYTALQEAFLVEMRSIGGYSGSPVFLYLPPHTYRMTNPSRPISNEGFLKLLGIDLGHIPTENLIYDKNGQIVEDQIVKSNSSMSCVVPAWKIQDILDMEHVKNVLAAREALIEVQRLKGDIE